MVLSGLSFQKIDMGLNFKVSKGADFIFVVIFELVLLVKKISVEVQANFVFKYFCS